LIRSLENQLVNESRGKLTVIFGFNPSSLPLPAWGMARTDSNISGRTGKGHIHRFSNSTGRTLLSTPVA